MTVFEDNQSFYSTMDCQELSNGNLQSSLYFIYWFKPSINPQYVSIKIEKR